MNTTNNSSSDIFKKAVQTDVLPVKPDPSVEERINYYFRLQHSRQKVYSNSILGFFGWIFSGQTVLIKTGFIALIAFFFLVKSPVIRNNSVHTGDTCSSGVLLTDTNSIVKDTCLN